jgi:hypothetical protein
METRYLKVSTGCGVFSGKVNLVRIDKRGALVEVAESYIPYKKRIRHMGERFYVPVNQARKTMM